MSQSPKTHPARLPHQHHIRRQTGSNASRHKRFLTDEIEALQARRFEDFTTIDWVQDTLFERARRQKEAHQKNDITSNSKPWSHHRLDTLKSWSIAVWDAAQSWVVVSLVGVGIGLNAALVSIITQWLSDLKNGYCSTGWWLNQKFCCWEIDDAGLSEEGCQDWVPWFNFWPLQYIVYVMFAALFSASSAFLVRSFAPYAAGSGISEIKCILAGFIIKGFLGPAVLIIKSFAMPLAIASGLSVGKEGPSVHVASSMGHVVASMFHRFARSQAKMREIVAAASAAGVAVAFGSPIGGVLFAFEEMTVNFPIKTMWRSFFCALVATVTLSAINPFKTGKLVLFQVSYDRDWHFFEVGFFILIGIAGGLYGPFVTKYHMQVMAFRRKHLANHGLSEAIILAILTAVIGYFNRFVRIDMTQSLELLFRECEGGGDYEGLCQSWAQWRMVNSLLLATVLRILLVILSYGCKVPAGIFVPSMAIGATFGRMVGILVKALYRSHMDWAMFAACDPEKPCITPGTYAFLGAASFLGGVMQITVTVVVIMFELTGALTYILPTMIVLMVTKAVSEFFMHGGGIADQMIRFNGFPILDKEDHAFNLTVGQVMKKDVTALPASGMRLDELEARITATKYQGFPVVASRTDTTLLGYIARSDLQFAIAKAQRSAAEYMPDTTVVFNPSNVGSVSPDDTSLEGLDDDDEEDASQLDFGSYMNATPLCVAPQQPLEIVMQLFKKMGPRVILIETHGHLSGLITIKDILKETIALERRTHNDMTTSSQELEQDFAATLEEGWVWLKDTANYVWAFLTWQALPVRRTSLGERRGTIALPDNESVIFDAETPQSPRTPRKSKASSSRTQLGEAIELQ